MKKKNFRACVCVIQAFNDWLIVHQQQLAEERERHWWELLTLCFGSSIIVVDCNSSSFRFFVLSDGTSWGIWKGPDDDDDDEEEEEKFRVFLFFKF